jgi:hypothetical protein
VSAVESDRGEVTQPDRQKKKEWVSAARPPAEQDPNAASTFDNSHDRLAHLLAQADADLARVLDAWPTLPPHIKVAILALVETSR